MEVNASLINFAAGQLSKKFLGRVDLPNFYKAGALICLNFIPQAQGPVEYRPGFQYIIHTRLNGLTALHPFVFNDDQAYALAFSDKKLRFFSDGGIITESSGETQSKFLAHFNGVDAATTYTAESGQVITFVGDAQLDTAQKEFGTASLLLDGTGDYVTFSSNALSFGTGDFTIDMWLRPNISNGTEYQIFDTTPSGVSGSGLRISRDTNDKLYVQVAGTSWDFGTWQPTNGTWYHLAVVRSSGSVMVFIDGVQAGSTQTAAGNVAISGSVRLGSGNYTGSPWNGHIDEPRIVIGSAEWTANFTPPTSEYSSSGIISISAITEADPGVITAGAHGYSDGDEIYISGIEGMTELNNKYFLVVYIDTDTFSLTDIDGTAIDTSAYTTYTAGGVCDKIYEIDTPYTEDDILRLQFAQKADLTYIIHPDYEPRKLTRAGETDWTLAVFTRTADPFTKAVTGITAADPGVVTAVAHGFSDGDLIELWGVVGMTEVNGNTYKVANKADNTFELTDSVTGADVDTSGFTAYTSGGVVFVQGNMPGAGAFYGGRMCYGGTDDDPETFWGSKAPDNDGTTNYDVFTVGASEEDAFVFPIASQNNMADRIQWFSGTNKFLGIGTFGGIYKANGGSDSTPISGTDILVQPVDFVGCKYLQPVRVGSSIFYVQRGGQVLNKFEYSILSEGHKSSSLNVFSDEITAGGITQITVQQGVADIIWGTTGNGNLLGLTVNSGEEISAWHTHTPGGTDVEVLSVCGEPQADNRDSLWVVTERTINGSTRRFVEYLDADTVLPEEEDYYTGVKATDMAYYRRMLYETAKQLIRVDSSLTYDAAQSTPITPGALTGDGVTFTASAGLFTATDVGRYIVKKCLTGEETGIAKIVGYTSATVVTCNIEEDFDVVTIIGEDDWYLSVTSVSGLDHLEGETVRIQIDGADGGTATVASGAITLPTWGTVIHVGLSYLGRLTTMPLDIGALVGTAQGKTTTVNKLGLLVRNTLGVKYGTDLYNLEQVQSRDYNEYFNRPPALVTDVLMLRLSDGYARRKFIHIVQDSPMPCSIQGIVPYVDTTNE